MKTSRGQASARILFLTHTLGGGTGAHLVRLLDELDRGRCTAELLCFGERAVEVPSHVPLHPDLERGSLHRFPLAQWREFRHLSRVTRASKPDILHTFFFWPIVYGRLLRATGRISHLVENREDQGFNWGPMEYRVLRATGGAPDRVVCVSDAVRDVVLAKEGLDEAKVVVIRNGIPLPPTPPTPEDRASARRALGLEKGDPVVGMAANLNRAVKGVEYFVESVPLILEAVPDTRFVIAGDGSTRAALEAQAESLGVSDRLNFLGFRTDMDRIYPAFDVSVLTSLSEGLSITILESMSSGIPVVATAVGGNPELVEEGRTGFLVPPRDPDAFASRVTEVLANPELGRTLGAAGRNKVAQEFSLSDVAGRYAGLYEALLDRGPR
ncbi:MAG: glycosyltransferase family 4 protein [Gemmatimonadota bacterium]